MPQASIYFSPTNDTVTCPLRFTNELQIPVEVLEVTATAPFQVVGDVTERILQPGQEMNVVVSVSPEGVALNRGTLTLHGFRDREVDLQVDPAISAKAPVVRFDRRCDGPIPPQGQMCVGFVANIGDEPFSVTRAELTNTDSFFLNNSSQVITITPLVVEPGTQLGVSIFHRSAVGGTALPRLTFTADGVASAGVMDVSYVATDVSFASPLCVDGECDIGGANRLVLDVTNDGVAEVAINAIGNNSGGAQIYFIVSELPFLLAPNETRRLEIGVETNAAFNDDVAIGVIDTRSNSHVAFSVQILGTR
jgi:hypothetical protein